MYNVHRQHEEICQLNYQLECFQRENECLRSKVIDLECRGEKANTCFCDLQTKHCALEKNYQCLQATLSKREAELLEKEEEIQCKDKKIAEFEKDLYDAKCHLEQFCKMYRDIEQERDELKLELERVKCENDHLKVEVKANKECISKLDECNKEWQCKYKHIDDHLKRLINPNNKDKSISFIDTVMSDEARANTTFCKTEVANVIKTLKEDITSIACVFTQKPEEALLRCVKLMVDKAFADKKGCEMKEQLEQKDKQVRSLQQDLQNCIEESAKKIRELQCTIQQLECELKSKTLAHDKLHKAYEQQSKRVADLEKTLLDEKHRCEMALGEKRQNESDMMCQIEGLCHELRCAEDEVRRKNQLNEELEKNMEQAECLIKELQISLGQEKEAQEECNRKLQEYMCQYNTKEKQVCDQEKYIDEIEDHRKKLKQQVEVFCQMQAFFDGLIATFMEATNSLAVKYGPPELSEFKCSSEGTNYQEFNKRLELVTVLAVGEPDDKETIACLQKDVSKKEKQLSELMCCLTNTQAKNSDLQQMVQDLEVHLKQISNQLAQCNEKVDQEIKKSTAMEKLAAEYEAQVRELSRLKPKVECLEQKLTDTENALEFEKRNAALCEESMLEMQKNMRLLQDEVKSKTDCCNMLKLQVESQECEIKELGSKVRALLGCNGPPRQPMGDS